MVNSTHSKSLFRENAIKSLNSIDDVQFIFKVTQLKSWVFILISIVLLSGLLIYAIYGRFTINLSARGILISDEQFRHSEKLIDENIKLYNERVDSLHQLLIKSKQLYKKEYITLADLEKTQYDYLEIKKELLNVPKNDMAHSPQPVFSASRFNTDLDALIFVKNTEGKTVLPGMNAYVIPTTFSPYEYGYMKGKVVSVSSHPVSKESVYLYLGNKSLTDEFYSDGVPFMARIQLLKNSENASSLQWTTKHGPHFKIEPGTMITVKIIKKELSLLQLLMKRDSL